MSGEMVPLLRGAQSGDAETFTCLYAATNPLIVRYLRVVSDADPAPVAVATWSSLLDGMSAYSPGDDDDWLEHVVGTARDQSLAATPSGAAAVAGPDQVEEAIAALRACRPDVAEVLAMGVVAGLGRDSIARITGYEPTEVLALVLAGQAQLGRPPATLSATFGVPATDAEVRDLPVVLPLFAAQAHGPLPAVTTATARPAFTLITGGATAASAGGAAVVAPAGHASGGSAFASAGRRRGAVVGLSPRVARVGAGAAAWTVAVGGVAAAAALIGVAPAAFDSLFGNGGAGSQGIVAAHGPTRSGGLGTTTSGPGQQSGPSGPTPQPGQPGQPVGPQGPGVAGAGNGGPTGTPSTGETLVSTSTAGLSGRTQVVVVSAVLTSPLTPTAPTTSTTPPTPTAPATPSAPGGIPAAPPPAPPSSSSGSGTPLLASAVKAAGTGHPKHSTGLAKGRAKAAQAAAARARAKAAAKAKAAAAAAARAKAARSKA